MARRKSWLNRKAVSLLRGAQKRIMRRPSLFDMGLYGGATSCGTRLCIAGNVCVLGGARYSRKAKCFLKGKKVVGPGDFAGRRLGITVEQADTLFHASGWPEKLRAAYCQAKSHREIAKIGCTVIEDFIWNKPKAA